MYARVALYLAYQRPVRLARIHLAPRPSVNCQCFNATVLQLFSQFRNDQLFVVPSQARFYRYRQLYRLYHPARYLQQLRYVLQHASPSPLARYLLYGAAKVQVYHVGSSLLYYFRSLHHRLYVAPVYLDAYRSLRVADGQLLYSRFYVAYQGLGAYKLRIHHRRSKPLTQQSEPDVRHVLHRRQKHRPFAKFYIAYFHFRCKGSHFSDKMFGRLTILV